MKLQPFRDETLRDPVNFRNRLNELVRAINAAATIVKVVRIPNVQLGNTLILPSPSFTVGAVVMGGVNPTNGGAAPTAAPWVNDWTQLQDGSVKCSIGGLPVPPSQYAVNLVLIEATT